MTRPRSVGPDTRTHQIWQTLFDVSPGLALQLVPWAVVEEEHGDAGFREGVTRYPECRSQILLTVSGAGYAELKNERVMLRPGMALLDVRTSGACAYGYWPKAKEPWRFINLYMRGGSEEFIRSVNSEYGHIFNLDPENDLLTLLRSYRGHEKNAIQVISPFEAGLLCFRALDLLTSGVKAARVGDPQDILVEKAMFIVRQWMHCQIKPIDIAVRCNVSYSHLSRVFKSRTGMTLSRFIDEEKVKAAEAMLDRSFVSCKEVAQRLAIEPGTTFYRLFRRTLGRSPRAGGSKPDD